jgi:hypothetical protein
MSRSLSAAMLAEIVKQKVAPVIFCQAQFVSGTIYVWSGLGTITWNSQAWIGLGNLGKISPIAESTDGTAKGITLELSGIPADLVADALTETGPASPVTIWLGMMDRNGNVVADPEQRFKGITDVIKLIDGGETATIQINVESKMIDLGRARERHYTHQDQQIDFPGDNGFIYVNGLQELNDVWGAPGSPINNLPAIWGGSSAAGGPSHGGTTGKGHNGGGRSS